MTVLRDAIHGGIEINDLEKKVIDHAAFQRLRRVRQLSLVHLVYPSALHTRFEHSLGSMHLTGRLAERLKLDASDLQIVRLAALLHDVGHGAFSHTSDALLFEKTGKTHEMRGLDVIKKTDLFSVLEKNGVPLSRLKDVFEGYGAGALITSELGCDRIDYLLRDGTFTGVSYSLIDHQRLLETLTLQGDELLIQEKGVVAAESLLVSRHLMFNAVYLHPTVRICEAMVEKMLRQSVDEQQLNEEDIAQGTDDALLSFLKEKNGLAARLWERRLFKKAYVLEMARASAETKKFLQSEQAVPALSDALEITLGSEFVVCLPPARKKHLGIRVLGKDGSVGKLEDYSNLLSALNFESGRDALIIACPQGLEEKAKKA
ncbi:MAG TPA: HD domain-containing protein, partial [Candidatus Norongarragalinales archaeon]|nr:HD domain-containing protein [Candidatus Norongarragalinales archaeon]